MAERLGYVSTEGGPLLIADRSIAVKWRGSASDGADYQRACALLESARAPGAEIDIAGKVGVVWDMPTGTAEVWRRDRNALVLTRSWLEPDDNRARLLAGLAPDDPVQLGTLEVHSGWLVMVWAAESGDDVASVQPSPARQLDLSIGHAGVVISMPNGTYTCYHDEIDEGPATARRCFIARD